MPSMIPFRPAPFAVTTDYEGNPIRAGGDSFGLHEDVTRVNAAMAGPSRWNSGMRNDANIGLAREMDPLLKGEDLTGQDDSYAQNPSNHIQHSPSLNPHSGYHPSSYGVNLSFSAATLGAQSSHGSSSLGMSISPPHWAPGKAPWGTSGSYVGSLGAMGASFGRERDRELEAKYVKDFSCCARQLNGLHELLEHYEEEHANLAPDLRMAALNAAQNGNPLNAQGSRSEASQQFATMSGDSHIAPPQIAAGSLHLHQNHGDAPTPPGMQDIEMEEPHRPSLPPAFLQMPQPTSIRTTGFQSTTPQSPWATAFRPQGTETPPHGVPPSLLSFAPPNSGLGSRPLTPEQVEAKASKKAQRKAEKAAAKDEASASDAEGEKRFLCPISGCGKVYKQANGLKYHLTRSINSGHGKVAALGGLTSLLGEKGSDTEI